ncbi:hypothetical protein AK812_SmicGene42089 [Symbiodinium microadriaticum]|uniref:Uncharacterized protein n=1 Tax=Symbiodinium microadriaticum TaxID=2951 RepID=A0A1Q9C4G8_SYMMI|nr:hypothetical protein AK812_SmicGene42089 [Symbiodinium microadriaticum]
MASSAVVKDGQELATFRRQVFTHHASVEAAFAAHTPAETAVLTELTEEQFRNWHGRLLLLDQKVGVAISNGAVPFAAAAASEEEDAEQLAAIVAKADVQARCRRLFAGLATMTADTTSVTRIKQVFAEVAPRVSFGTMRRRILLGYFSVAGLMSEVLRSPWDDSDEAEIDTGSAGRIQAEKISELLEVQKAQVAEFVAAVTAADQGASGRRRLKMPEDGTGFSLEEFAIIVFLCKPIDKSLEDLAAELSPGDRDRALSFEEFQRYVIKEGDRPGPTLRALPKVKAKAASKAKAALDSAKRQSAPMTKAPTMKSAAGLSSFGGILPARCTAAELRLAYEALERPGQSVTVNSILTSLCNITDVLAIDQRSYQGGDRIVCRVRLGSELAPLCGKCPVLALVPSRLFWNEEEGTKGFWSLDGQKVKSFSQIGCLPHPLPGPSASMRDCVVWLTAPWSVSGHRAYDIRLFCSEQHRVPGKQVGGSVSFVLQLPMPPEPAAEKPYMQMGETSCAVSLRLKPPLAANYCPPIQKYILHIEPVLPARQEILDCQEGAQVMHVQRLQCGVPYRFASQCVYQVSDPANGETREVKGACSELCAPQTMPSCPFPPNPGVPEVRLLPDTGQMEILEILLPLPSGATDGRPHHEVEYRAAGADEWKRIDGSRLFFSHEHKWDDRLDSFVSSCMLMGLKPVLPERNGVEFRVRSTNVEGQSTWSGTSAVLKLREKEEDANADQSELQVTAMDVLAMTPAILEQEGTVKLEGGGKRGLRTHCRLQWIEEDGPNVKYQVEAREERLPFYVVWSILPMYHRTEVRNDKAYSEVLVSGLEQFPAAEPLALRVVKLASGKAAHSVRATLRINGVVGPPAAEKLELTRTLTAPGSKLPLAEVSWTAEKDSGLKGFGYLVEASWELDASRRSDWSSTAAAVMQVESQSSPTGFVNLGFVPLQMPQEGAGSSKCWLRVRCQSNDGRLSDAFAEAEAPVVLADALLAAEAAQEALRNAAPKAAPRRPQQLNIRGGSRNLWQVSWEQRGKLAADILFEAEICFRTALDAQDWKPVRSFFLPQRSEDVAEEGTQATTLTAAVELVDSETMPEEAWRLRVRAAGGNWSTPTPWKEQDDSQEVFLLQLAKPEVRCNAFSFSLEFDVAVDGEMPAQLPRGIGFEIQVQGRKRRASSKFCDWTGLRSFCTAPEQVEDTSTVLVRALVERATVAEAIKASFGYEELRFRVRASTSQGYSSPSEPSDLLALQMEGQASKALPPLPTFLGRGFLLMEDAKSKSLTHSEILQLCWPKPELDVGELNDGLPPLEYKLEQQHQIGEEETDWEPVPTAMLFSEPASQNISALLPLEQDIDELDEDDLEYAEQESRLLFQTSPTPSEARFRLCADRPSSDISKFEPVHSKPSDVLAWKLPDLPSELHVVGQSCNMICLIFNWPRLSQVCGGHLWACVEALGSSDKDGEVEFGEESLGQSIIGMSPLVWQPAIELQPICKHYEGQGGSDPTTASELVAKACAAATSDTCVGLTPLPDSCASSACVRIRLQLYVRQSIHQSGWSQPLMLEKIAAAAAPTPQKIRTLHLQYPRWTCILPGLDETSGKFSPRLVLRETADGEDPRETTLLDEASDLNLPNLKLKFEVVQGDLPACLLLDCSNGSISWRHVLVDGDSVSEKSMQSVMDAFAIQVSVMAGGESELGLEVPSALCASTVLHLAAAPSIFRGDDAAWEFLGGILKGPALEVLSERGIEALQAASELLQDQELLEGFADFCEVLASDVGFPAFEIVMRILELPAEYMEHAAEMDPDDFLDVLCIALEADADGSGGSGLEEAAEDSGSSLGSDSEEGLCGLDGSHAEPESDAGDAQEGFSNSSDDGVEAAAGLVGQVRSDLGVEDSGQATRTDEEASEDRKKQDEQPPLKSPSSGVPRDGPKRSSIFASVGKSIAALGIRRGSVTGRRNSALAARRASRVERRMSKLHLPDEDTADVASASMPVGKFRSIRRMSSHAANVDEPSPSHSKLRASERLQREVEIAYPTLMPLWPAFEELEFQPHLQAKRKHRRRSILHSNTATGMGGEEDKHHHRRESLPQHPRFSINPGLPPQISFDENTGIIRGCPLMEHVAGRTYTISVWDRTSCEEALGKCSVAFAVAPAEVAKLCNAAFAQDATSSKEAHAGYPSTSVAPDPATPSTRGEEIQSPKPASTASVPSRGLDAPKRSPALARVQPPVHSARPWMTPYESLKTPWQKPSRQAGVICLGPPLKDRVAPSAPGQPGSKGRSVLPPVNLSTPRGTGGPRI